MQPPSLEHIGLRVGDLDRARRFLGEALGLPEVEVPGPGGPALYYPVGPVALEVWGAEAPEAGSGPPGVHHLGLRVEGLEAALASWSARGLQARDASPFPLPGGGRGLFLDPSALGGVSVHLVEGPAPLSLPSGGTGLVQGVDHIGVATSDLGAFYRSFVEALGFPVESQQTDMEVAVPLEAFVSDRHGVVYLPRAPDLRGAVRVLFISLGGSDLEVIQPLTGEDLGLPLGAGPGSTRGDWTAIARFLERRGPGLHHIALRTPDIRALLEGLAGHGLDLIDPAPRPGSRRADIAFLHPRSTGGILVHLVQRPAR